jgi:5'-deoxynucleotidase YfbR-like HD superfamily hydrolase
MSKLNIEGLYLDTPDIRTYTGIYVDVSNPQPDMFNIEDIAHALSMQPRFGGHLRRFYSVAQHSIFCACEVPHEYAFAALMHDASEAYLCDIPSPIKKLIPEYKVIEEMVMKCIAEKFGFKLHQDEIKDVDKYALEYEWSMLVKSNSPIQYMDQEKAEKKFLALYEILK